MAQLVPSCARYSIIATNAGRPVVNVLDMFIGENYGEVERPRAVEIVAGLILDAWDRNIMSFLPGGYAAQRIEYVDLSEANGVTGEISGVLGIDWPASGRGGGGDPYAALVANLVTKETTRRRGERPGRWFLAPQAETYMSGNSIATARLATMQTSLDTFLDDVSVADSGPLIDQAWPVVTHFPGGGEIGSFSRITALSIRGRVSSQRRRGRAGE